MKKSLRWLPAILCMVIIFTLSHQPGDELNTWMPFFQKWFPAMQSFDWGHFVAYFVLCAAFYWAMPQSISHWKAKLAAIALSVLFGLTDEFHQHFIEGRMSDVKDLRNDAIGAAAAMLLLSAPPLHRLFQRARNTINY
ncbi:VanZ family protein [Marinicrinis lubricantis]|uniref:VanZ family protein n=1 Tax=Marinicrinis lubricantis TaxID=2086470 RepID=A0ABW1IQI6_9BACL